MSRHEESAKMVVSRSNSGLGFRLGFGYIPDWLIVELLIRLPIKCIYRCKCVSTQRLSLINESTFARAFVSMRELPSAYQNSGFFFINVSVQKKSLMNIIFLGIYFQVMLV
ncbi:hypothetical protein ACH5RR_003683 [Cinchona calisaya]|uniref:Uncharacterized protein n=1 Tax=Cinchona calisaya TaxID=153742 RepID=A0ABD3AVF6_9GENT